MLCHGAVPFCRVWRHGCFKYHPNDFSNESKRKNQLDIDYFLLAGYRFENLLIFFPKRRKGLVARHAEISRGTCSESIGRVIRVLSLAARIACALTLYTRSNARAHSHLAQKRAIRGALRFSAQIRASIREPLSRCNDSPLTLDYMLRVAAVSRI